ncbi:Arc family DNA-binding protein [Citrobacter amalonaticus]|uniref:Arc family DNA-binding protein n=1 Tax=Citrobacter amalonaticus TaxID=35703 RepID=UPI0009B85DDF|nr:Arc family DNA-binding protein [Citrobacter amalonaticus]MBJ9259757.1 Arc family DNA-binding protein [Citrobacter amalonaticus]MBJ9325827.1 Arc family DNA-binding protein [Citrobacter amalonaticus]
MSKKEVTAINPMQLRIPPEMKERIAKNAEKSFRTIHSEVLYRLQLIDDMERRGEICV